MPEYDYTTAQIIIEQEPYVSPEGYVEDSGIAHKARPFVGSYSGLTAIAILAFASWTAPISGLERINVPTITSYTQLEVSREAKRIGKRISLADACRMAEKLQARIDAEYDKELEHDANIRAVWE